MEENGHTDGARLDNPQAGIWHGLIMTITAVPECELSRKSPNLVGWLVS